jgi:hypothetical protein
LLFAAFDPSVGGILGDLRRHALELGVSRYLAAERLIADGNLTQEQRGEVLSALVQAMVSGPSQPPADTPNS